MPRFFRWVSEQDRRRDAAIEAATLGQGGMESSARGLACEPNPRRPGLHALAAREAAAAGRLRPPGLAARRAAARRRPWPRLAVNSCRSAPRAIHGAQACGGRASRSARCHGGSSRWAPPPGGARSGGGGAPAPWAAAPRGSPRRGATIPTAPPTVQPAHACGARTRRPVRRGGPATRNRTPDAGMCTGPAPPVPRRPSKPSPPLGALRARRHGCRTGWMPWGTIMRPATFLCAPPRANGGVTAGR